MQSDQHLLFPRSFVEIDARDATLSHGPKRCDVLRILSFNVLADGLAQTGNFTYPAPSVLTWKIRFPLLMTEIRQVSPDIICLAECNHYEDCWLSALEKEVPPL